MNQINTFSNMILKAGFSYLHIEAVTLFHGINQHATMMVRVSIEQETANQLINRSFANGVLSLNNQETKEVLFAGMIDQIQVKMENQVWQAELQVVSLTQKMDIEKKQRSFQNQQLSYQAIFSEVIKNHKNSQFINVNGLEQPRNGLVLQYDETDWELLMRLAGRNQTFLIPDIAEARPRFWIGNKLGKRINLPATKYKINKAYQEYKDIQENFIETLHMEDFYQLTFKTTERAELGDYVNHENTVYSIIEKRAQTNGAVLYFDYLAIPRNLIKYWKYPSNRNIGLTIEGKVLAVQGHMVKVHLDIDQHQNKNQAVWLPYVTEGSNMTYYMPEIGSKVKVYFPKAEEQQVMVTQGVRTKKDLYRSQMSDPTTKILSNLQGKKISLEPDNLNILSQDGLSITLTDNSNIAISSPSAINMHSSSDISLSSHQSISISGDQGVVLQGKNTSSISISSDIQLSSPDLQYTGGSGAKASHKSLEGNNKNQRQKRSTQSIPIQQLDSIGFIQKAVSSLPAVSATKHDNQGIGKITSLARSVIPSVNNVKKIETRTVKKKTTTYKKASTGNIRAKLMLNDLTKKKSKNPLIRTLPAILPVKPNGNVIKKNIQNEKAQDKPKFSTFENQSTLFQKESISSLVFAKPLIISPLQEEKNNQVKPIYQNSTLKRTISGQHINSKISSLPMNLGKPDQQRLQKKMVSKSTQQGEFSTKADSLKSANWEIAGIQPIQVAPNGSTSSLSGNSGASSGGGFGVVNKGASSAVSRIKLISAKTQQMVKASNQQKTYQYIKNLKLKKITSAKNIRTIGTIQAGTRILKKKNVSTTVKSKKTADVSKKISTLPNKLIFNSIASDKLYRKADTNHIDKELRHLGFDPVDLISGAYRYQQTDFKTKGKVPVNWYWEWSSSDDHVGSLGNRITFAYDEHLEIDHDNSVIWHFDAEGKVVEYPWLFDGHSVENHAKKTNFSEKDNLFLLLKREEHKLYWFVQSKQNPDYYCLKEIQHVAGNKLVLTYNRNDQLETIIDSNDLNLTIQYNSLGFIETLSTSGKNIVNYEYSNEGDLLRVTDIEKSAISFEYDEAHRMVKRTDKNTISFHWVYDNFGRVIHTWGDGHLEEGWITYQEDKGMNIIRDYYGNETSYYYDSYGLVQRIAFSDGTNQYYQYDDQFRLIQIRMKDNQFLQNSYNEHGWLICRRFNNATEETYEYDDFGRLLLFTDRAGWVTRYKYSDNGLLNQILENEESIFKVSCDAENNTIVTYKEQGKIIDCLYDNRGQLVRTKQNNEKATVYEYDSFGNCTLKKEIVATDSQTYHYFFDEKQRLIQVNNQNQIEKQFSYNSSDQLVSCQSKQTNYQAEYNSNNKISKLILSAKNEFYFFYDFEGNISEIKNNNSIIYKIKRDSQRRLITEIFEKDIEQSFEYDEIGRIKKIIFSDNSWTLINYDANGLIFEVLYSDDYWEKYHYDTLGRIQIAENANVLVTLQYDKKGNIIMEETKLARSEFPSTKVKYLYDSSGKLSSYEIEGQLSSEILRESNKKTQKTTFHKNKSILIETNYDYSNWSRRIDKTEMVHQWQPDVDLIQRQIKTPIMNKLDSYSLNNKKQIRNFIDEIAIKKDIRERISTIDFNGETIHIEYSVNNLIQVIQKEDETYHFIYDCFGRLLYLLSDKINKSYFWTKNLESVEISATNKFELEIVKKVYDFDLGDLVYLLHYGTHENQGWIVLSDKNQVINYLVNYKGEIVDVDNMGFKKNLIDPLSFINFNLSDLLANQRKFSKKDQLAFFKKNHLLGNEIALDNLKNLNDSIIFGPLEKLKTDLNYVNPITQFFSDNPKYMAFLEAHVNNPQIEEFENLKFIDIITLEKMASL